jgi:hypothetical protein
MRQIDPSLNHMGIIQGSSTTRRHSYYGVLDPHRNIPD